MGSASVCLVLRYMPGTDRAGATPDLIWDISLENRLAPIPRPPNGLRLRFDPLPPAGQIFA
jgi:hypothetical protein